MDRDRDGMSARRWLAEHWLAIASPVWCSSWRGRSRARPGCCARRSSRGRPPCSGTSGALVADGTLPGHTLATLVRLGWAFALAAVLGVAVGLAMGLWRRLRAGLDPVFAVIYPIPSVLFLPLVSFLAPRGRDRAGRHRPR